MSTIVTTIDPERQMLGEVEMVGRERWEEIHRRASSGASIRAIAVARDLDLTASALRHWVERTRADQTGGRTGLTTAERDELAQLRKENRELRTERDLLKKPRARGDRGASSAQAATDRLARSSPAGATPDSE